MRLIDADKLYPEEMCKRPQEVYMNGKDYNLYLEGYKQGKKDFERPQGEWKLISTGLTYKYQCSLCGRTISTTPMFLADYPFCHCGAKMKGEEE